MPTLQELTLDFMKALVAGQNLGLHLDPDRVYNIALDLALTFLEKQK